MTSALIYSHIASWSDHHAQTIELAWSLHERGLEVTVLSCVGALSSCPANPNHTKSICAACVTQTTYSRFRHFPPKTKFLTLSLADDLNLDSISNFKTQDEFEAYSYKGVPIGALSAAQLIDDHRDIEIDLDYINSKGVRLLREGVALFEYGYNLLENSKFEEVYVWNGRRNCDGPLLFAATSLNISAYTHESGATKDKFLLFAGELFSLSAWNKSIKEYSETKLDSDGLGIIDDAKSFYASLQSGNGLPTNYIWFGKKFTKTPQKYFPSVQKKNLAIFTSSLWEFHSFPERKLLVKEFRDPYSLIQTICNSPEILSSYNVVVRWHPNLESAGAKETQRMHEVVRMSPDVTHVLPPEVANSYGLLAESDVVLTTGSTIGIEAAYLGKVSILAGIGLYGESGSVYSPDSMNSLLSILKEDLPPLDNFGAIKFGAWARNLGTDFKTLEYDASRSGYFLGRRPISPWRSIAKKIKSTFPSWTRYFPK